MTHQTPPDEPTVHSDTREVPPAVPTRKEGNPAVPLGAILILVSFFLPWVFLEGTGCSGFELAFKKDPATALLLRFGVWTPASSEDGRPPRVSPNTVTRPLVLVPLLALGVIMLEVSSGRALLMRLISRGLTFTTGTMLAVGFAWFGTSVMVVHPAPAFWMVVMGGLLVALGSVTNVLRGT